MHVVGVERGQGGLATVLAQRVDEPAGMRRAQCEVAINGVQDVRLFALEPSQDRVDETGGLLEPKHPGRTHGFRNGGVRGRLAGDQLEESDLEQRPQPRRELVG
jgi:hypothetical protein